VSRLIFNQLSTTPSDTDAGSSQLYLKDNGGLYLKNASNTEVALLTGADTTSVWVSGNGAGNINYTGGNVGIGTTGPTEELHVVSDSTGTIRLDGSAVQLEIQSQGSTRATIATLTNHPLRLSTQNTERMVILGDGKVGIGSTVPSEMLSVAGAVSATNACKAWFNWSDGAGDFERSYNMSSETDNGTGDYSFAFTTPMDNANFCVVMGSSRHGGESSSTTDANTLDFSNATVNGFKIRTSNGGAYVNHENVCAAIFDTA